MDLKTISATLAILGTSLTLSACKKAPAEGTEVPGDKAGGAEGSCGADKGHGHANCSGDKAAAPGEGSCGEKKDGACGGEKAADPAEPAEPPATAVAPTEPTPTATAADPAAAKPAETATKTKSKSKSKTKAKGEAACGEGTCS